MPSLEEGYPRLSPLPIPKIKYQPYHASDLFSILCVTESTAPLNLNERPSINSFLLCEHKVAGRTVFYFQLIALVHCERFALDAIPGA